MTRDELLKKIEVISVRNEELLIKEQTEGLTANEIQDAIILGEWLDELANEEITNQYFLRVYNTKINIYSIEDIE